MGYRRLVEQVLLLFDLDKLTSNVILSNHVCTFFANVHTGGLVT